MNKISSPEYSGRWLSREAEELFNTLDRMRNDIIERHFPSKDPITATDALLQRAEKRTIHEVAIMIEPYVNEMVKLRARYWAPEIIVRASERSEARPTGRSQALIAEGDETRRGA